MIYLEILAAFLKIGLISFGGGYGAVPIIRDTVLSHGWLTEDMFTYFVAVSESTPGPIMVNIATYVGSSQAGFFGALVATAGVVLPSFVVILIITAILKNFMTRPGVLGTLGGINACIAGLVTATGIYMLATALVGNISSPQPDAAAFIIAGILILSSLIYKKLRGKKLSPIIQILIAAVCGIFMY